MATQLTRSAVLALALLVSAATAGAQTLMSSTNFQVQGISHTNVSGGVSSGTFTAHLQVGPLGFGESSSSNFANSAGFLLCFEPDPGSRPVLYTVTPHHAHKSGGDTVDVYGRNLGLALSPTFTMGGNPAPGTVVSETHATLTTPTRAAGEVNVSISHAGGSMTLTDGFVFSPAIDTPEFAYQDSLWPLISYGDTSHTFQMWLAFAPLTPGINTNFGLLLIAPPLINLIPGFPYLGPDGRTEVALRVPIEPALVGFSFYMQNVNLDPLDPPGQLTNMVAVEFK